MKSSNIVFLTMLSIALLACSPRVEYVKGPQGDPGTQGPTGANGHSLVSETVEANSCECDENGGQQLNIYVDMDDSLTVSEGDQFQSGLVACNGANGLNGTNGLPGADGPQGVPGEQGPQGIPGPQGEVGPEGAQGVAGPVGPMGPTGPQGATGAQGPAGAGAVLQSYTLTNTCQSVGSGYWATKSSDSAKLYSDEDCHHLVTTMASGQSSYWLSTNRLAFADSDTTNSVVLRVLNFN